MSGLVLGAPLKRFICGLPSWWQAVAAPRLRPGSPNKFRKMTRARKGARGLFYSHAPRRGRIASRAQMASRKGLMAKLINESKGSPNTKMFDTPRSGDFAAYSHLGGDERSLDLPSTAYGTNLRRPQGMQGLCTPAKEHAMMCHKQSTT